MAEVQIQNKPLVIHHFEEAVIGPSYGVYTKNGQPIPLAFLSRGNEEDDFPFGEPTDQNFVESDLNYDPRPCLWIRFAVFWHFGHLITETLANLWPLLELSNTLPENLVVIVPDAFRDDIDNVKSLCSKAVVLCNSELQGPTCFSKVLIPEPSCVDRNRIHPEHPRLLQGFREWLFKKYTVSQVSKTEEALNPKNESTKDKIYLSRSKLPQRFRKLIQEQQLEEQLIEAGWTILYPEKTSLEHQLKVISEAKILAGQWGSAFHLLMACTSYRCEQVVMLTMEYGAEINFSNQFQLQNIKATYLPCLVPIGKKSGSSRDLRLTQPISDITKLIATSIGDHPYQPGVDDESSIELHPGISFCNAETLNRIARQQGLCLAIAQASIFDEICKVISLPDQIEAALVDNYLQKNELQTQEDSDRYLQSKGWDVQDLAYFATKQERLSRFQQLLFTEDVELRFLARKTDLDEIHYSLIRVRDSNLAFELHQRLIEGEVDFAELASTYSEGPERKSNGQVGPVPLSQAHPIVVDKLRTSQPGKLWEPFFLEDIWVILRLDEWVGARLDEATRQHLLDELLSDWIHKRALQLLAGQTPDPLPVHRLRSQSLE